MASMLRSLSFVRRLNAGGRRLGASALHRAPSAAALLSTRASLLRPSIQGSVLSSLREDRTYITDAINARRRELRRGEFGAPANVDEMLRQIDYKTKMYGYVFKKDVDDVLKAVTVRGTLTSMQVLLLIRCCGYFMLRENTATREECIRGIWKLAKDLNVPIDVSHYNALLLVYLDNETDFSPSEILMEMKEKNISPNRVTFQRLIEQYCKKGDITGATKILEYMSQHEIPLNEIIFNSLIIGHSMANDVTNALKILDIMKQTNIEPTAKTYSAILCVHAKNGDFKSIDSFLKSNTDSEILFQDKDLLDVVYTLAINKHYDLVDKMIDSIPKSNIYNRHALPIICKLLDKGEHYTAYKLQKTLLKSSNDYSEELASTDGHLFLRKLLLNNCDADTAVSYCTLMVEEKVNQTAFETTLFIAYKNNMHHLALPLLKAMQKMKRPVREHYFYPLLVSHSKESNLKGILTVVQTMMSDYQLTPTILTIKDYVIPYMVNDNINNLTSLVEECGIPFGVATNAILIHLLDNNKTNLSMKFLLNTKMFCKIPLIEKHLVNAILYTKDINTLVNMLLYVVCTSSKKYLDRNPDEIEEDIREINAYKFVNSVVGEVIRKLPNHNFEIVTSILKGLVEKGLKLESTTTDQIKAHLGENITSEITDLLKQLTSENLAPAMLDIKSNPKFASSSAFKSHRLMRLQGKAENSLEYKMLLIQEQAKSMNIELVENLISELDTLNPTYTPGLCVTLVDYYSKLDNVNEAEKWFNRLHEINADIKVDKVKIVSYANVLVKNNRWTDALNLLDHKTGDENITSRACERLLRIVSDHCPEQIEVFFNKLNEHKYLHEINASLLGPIVKYYVDKGDMEKALEKFKWACETYKVTPHKSKIMIKLIQNEDANTLQNVTGLCTKIYGESNALFDLAICFLDCNRPKQARKILETPGLQIKQDRIRYVGSSYVFQGQTTKLENFIEVVSGLWYNVNPLYEMLLTMYEKENNWQKCLALWTQMQEDNIQPTVAFMNKLENVLKMNNQEIPFAPTEPTEQAKTIDKIVLDFSTALKSGNLSEAHEFLQKIPKKVRKNHLLTLIDHYLDAEDVDGALKSLKEFWNIDDRPIPSFQDTVTGVFQKFKDTNDFCKIVEVMMDAKNFCTKHNENFSLTYLVNKVFYDAGKYNDWFNYIESLLDDKTKAKKVLPLLFHPIITVQNLFDDPEFEDKLKNFAFKAREYDFWAPMNALWIHKFINNSPDAESFFKEHIKTFLSINSIYACKELKALNKMPELAQIIAESTELTYNAKRRNSSIMLRTLLKSDMPDKYDLMVQCLRNIVKVVPYSTLHEDICKALETNYEDKEALQALRTQEESKPRSQEAATA